MSGESQDVGKVAQKVASLKAASAHSLLRSRSLVLPTFIALRLDPRPGELLQDCWCVSETGDWKRDVAIGCVHARDAIRLIRQDRTPHLLN